MASSVSQRLLQDVEAFCEEIRPIEELCYVEHRYNDQVVPLARKHNLLAMPVPPAYGGRGADAVTYARALVRIGREGTGVRTFSPATPPSANTPSSRGAMRIRKIAISRPRRAARRCWRSA